MLLQPKNIMWMLHIVHDHLQRTEATGQESDLLQISFLSIYFFYGQQITIIIGKFLQPEYTCQKLALP